MENDSGLSKFNLVTTLASIFSLILLVGTAAGVFNNWFGFDLNEFDGAKIYFQTPEEQTKATTTDQQFYDGLNDVFLLNDAADSLSDSSESNKIPQIEGMINYYSKSIVVMPHLYNELVRYNRDVAITAIAILFFWLGSIWLLYTAMTKDKNKHVQTSKGLTKKVSILSNEVKKLKKQHGEKL